MFITNTTNVCDNFPSFLSLENHLSRDPGSQGLSPRSTPDYNPHVREWMKTLPMMSFVYGPGYLLSVSPWILYILNPIPDKPDRENARSLSSDRGIISVELRVY